MARQSHAPFSALGTKTSAYAANAADLTMQAADATNYEEVAHTGNIIVFAHNTDSSAHTVTVSSVVGPDGRSEDISAYSIGAGEYAVYGPFEVEGWIQTDHNLYFQANSATVKMAVIKLPL